MLWLSVRAVASTGAPVLQLLRMPGEAVPIIAIIAGVFGAVFFPLARALARRIDSNNSAVPPALPRDVADRLDRIERAVESVALEVERISEGQRFVTKVMAERNQPAALPSANDPSPKPN